MGTGVPRGVVTGRVASGGMSASTEPTTTLFGELKKAIADDWHDYTHHAFVEQLGAGTLPLDAFKDYLVQDYLFLIQFCRSYALAGYKGENLDDIQASMEGLQVILDETRLHVKLTASWGIEEQELLKAPEKVGTVAYTRYVLDAGMTGDLLDLHVALAPCVIGYAEIGERLAPLLERRDDHPYREWISTYASAEFQEGARKAVEQLDALHDRFGSPARFEQLAHVFRTATRMESGFWQQALEK